MIKRGVLFFIVNFLFNSFAFSASEIVVNYTVIPNAKILSGSFDPSNFYVRDVSGGFHNIIKEIVKDTNIKPNYINYDDYFFALENTIIYSPSNPEIMVGATFSEDATKYLDYVSVPVFKDSLVLVVNKNDLKKENVFSDSPEIDVKKLSIPPVFIKGLKVPYFKQKLFEEYKTVESAMEEVFLHSKVLLTSKTLVDKYLDKNSNIDKINNLKVIEYKDFPIYYFFVINKKSGLFTTKFDEDHFISDIIFERLQNMINNNEISKIIENK
ncbi:MAG: hypothetical protein IJ638_01745 [Alphaproteobacteria bacterium]|nr:hypothetical protein [Alphaproteobacteria bacterium]